MPTFSEHYMLNKSQAELDFVDIPLISDIPLFIDPFAISQRLDRWSQNCHLTLVSFFQRTIDLIRLGRYQLAYELLRHLREPNETRFGYSAGHPQGAGIGRYQARQLLDAFRESTAVQTGFINSLEECELMIPGISRDKISDLSTNILRKLLEEYTKDQCNLFGIQTRRVAVAPYYSPERNVWINDYYDLPVVRGNPILLVPKAIARYDLSYDQQKYYRGFVLEYLQAEALNANSSLVHTLKNGGQVVYKKEIAANFPLTKENIFVFSRDHPEVLEAYREDLIRLASSDPGTDITVDDETVIAETLGLALNSIVPGNQTATDYHNLMIGIVEFVFFPDLLYPKKEREIHQGRKRIDVVMENGAKTGIFNRLHQVRNLPCAFVALECKNYTNDVANPELDQLSGRFSPNRGRIGFLCCRAFENRDHFIERCRDTFRDDRGLIIPLDDITICEILARIQQGRRISLDDYFTNLINLVWYS